MGLKKRIRQIEIFPIEYGLRAYYVGDDGTLYSYPAYGLAVKYNDPDNEDQDLDEMPDYDDLEVLMIQDGKYFNAEDLESSKNFIGIAGKLELEKVTADEYFKEDIKNYLGKKAKVKNKVLDV